MCGIVGMLIKNPAMRGQLGELMTPMLVQMGARGPESAGLAVFRGELPESEREYSLHAPVWDYDWAGFEAEFIKRFPPTTAPAAQSHSPLLPKEGWRDGDGVVRRQALTTAPAARQILPSFRRRGGAIATGWSAGRLLPPPARFSLLPKEVARQRRLVRGRAPPPRLLCGHPSSGRRRGYSRRMVVKKESRRAHLRRDSGPGETLGQGALPEAARAVRRPCHGHLQGHRPTPPMWPNATTSTGSPALMS